MAIVYVMSRDGQPLMPTRRFGKVRRLLRDGHAKVVRRTPFTIQLLFDTGAETQEITLGVDAGSKVVGLSATTETHELFRSEVELRTDIVDKLATRRQVRRTRRNRLRYRPARFDNRKASKQPGWLAPSIRHKIECHLSAVAMIHKILPITHTVIEVASFDIQKIRYPEIAGTDYQQGEQLGFWNVREYVLFRDGHTCRHCRGKSKDPLLNVHHIESRKTGGDAPNNLVTLCETCHNKHHKEGLELHIKRGASFRDAAFMGIMRWSVYRKLKELYPSVSLTYGYLTKNTRIRAGLEKTHATDAYCITGNLQAKRLPIYILQKKVRCHNRQLHKANFLKGHRKKANQAPKWVKGFQLFDRVRYQGKDYFVFGRRQTGYFDIRTLTGERVNKGSVSYKKLQKLDHRRGVLMQSLAA